MTLVWVGRAAKLCSETRQPPRRVTPPTSHKRCTITAQQNVKTASDGRAIGKAFRWNTFRRQDYLPIQLAMDAFHKKRSPGTQMESSEISLIALNG